MEKTRKPRRSGSTRPKGTAAELIRSIRTCSRRWQYHWPGRHDQTGWNGDRVGNTVTERKEAFTRGCGGRVGNDLDQGQRVQWRVSLFCY